MVRAASATLEAVASFPDALLGAIKIISKVKMRIGENVNFVKKMKYFILSREYDLSKGQSHLFIGQRPSFAILACYRFKFQNDRRRVVSNDKAISFAVS